VPLPARGANPFCVLCAVLENDTLNSYIGFVAAGQAVAVKPWHSVTGLATVALFKLAQP